MLLCVITFQCIGGWWLKQLECFSLNLRGGGGGAAKA